MDYLLPLTLTSQTSTFLNCSTKKTDQFMDFVYLSQVIQAICIDAEAQHYRRMLSTEGVLTRGTLYWQLVMPCKSGSIPSSLLEE